MADASSENSRAARGEAAGPPQQALLAALREACQERGLTLEDVAEQAGLRDLLGRVEAGEDELRLRDVTALCAVLDVRVSELTSRAEALGQGEGER
jgi:transcriptional regulator with XRE-family HTH domain